MPDRAGPLLIGAMGIGRAEPEADRRIGRTRFEKRIDRLVGFPAWAAATGSPGFAIGPNVIAGVGEQLRILGEPPGGPD